MASTYTTGFGIEKIGSGEQDGTWGTTTNHNLDILDRIASYKAVAITTNADTATLTVREASPGSGTENLQDGMYRVIKFTGALDSNCTITIAPNTAPAWFIIENATTDSGSGGPYSLVLSQGSGANVTVQNGKNAIIYCDGAGSGAAVVDALADLQIGTLEVTGAAAIDGALTGSSTIQGTTITATTAFVPDASDGAALGTTSLEFSDLYLADGAVAAFGNDQDVTLTHVADTGLLLNSTNQLQFGDSGTYIYQSADGVLDLVSDTEIEINATTIDINGTANFSAAITPAASDGAALGTTSLEWSDLYLADGGVVAFGNDQDVTVTHVADTGLLLNSTRQIQFGDSGTYIHQSADGVLDLVSDTEIEINATTIDINGAVDVSGAYTGGGLMTTGGNIVIPDGGNIGSASDTDAIAISSGGVVTFSQTPIFSGDLTIEDDLYLDSDSAVIHFGEDGDITLTHAADTGLTTNGTFQATTITATTAVVPDASDGAALGTTSLEWSDLYLADGAVVGFGDDQDVTLTHVADTGLLLNSTMALQFNDASQYINAPSATVLDINATDEIELNATLADINANLDVSGTLTQAGASQFNSTVTVGVDDTGYDVKFFGATSGQYMLWDESADTLFVTGEIDAGSLDVSGQIDVDGVSYLDAVVVDGTVTVGVDDTGYDVKFFGDTASRYWLWDTSADGVVQRGTLTVGVDDTGHDVKFFGATSGRYMEWDESQDVLRLSDNVQLQLGTGGDLILYHAPEHSYIQEGGSGNLYIQGTNLYLQGRATGETMLGAVENGAVELYYDASKKIETTTDGVRLSDASSVDISTPLLTGADHTCTGLTAQMLAGGTISAFDLVCVHTTTGEVVEADASAYATARVIGIAPAAISDTATGTILLQGFIRDDSWSWTTGSTLYLSETAGAMTHTPPSTDGAFVNIVGVALEPDVVYINPSMDVIERA